MDLVTVRKGNRILTVANTQKNSYLKDGYDVVDSETGEVVERATGGRAVSLAEHYKVVDELNQLKAGGGGDDAYAELELKYADLDAAYEELKKENSVLKGKITKLENQK